MPRRTAAVDLPQGFMDWRVRSQRGGFRGLTRLAAVLAAVATVAPASAAAFSVAFALLVGGARLEAQQEASRPDTVHTVAPISVHAVRPAVTVGGGSALEVRIDSLPLAPAPTLEQVLRRMPLVQVRTNSRGEAQFSLRGSGSDARQVAVLVDGIPLSLGWDHRADLSVLPATAATSLVLVRGLPSVLHGPNVLGGVLEVGVGHHPGQWMPPRSSELSAGVESTGALLAAASLSRPYELRGGSRFAVRAGAAYRDRPGIALPTGVTQPSPATGSPFGAFDSDLRANTDLRHVDGFLALRWLSADGAWATLSSSAFRAERGIAAELHSATPRYWRYPHVSRSVAVVSGGTGDRATVFGGIGDLEASVGVDLGRSELIAYRSAAYTDVRDREEGDDRTVTLRLLGDHTLGSRGGLRGSFTYADIHRDEILSGAAAYDYRQRIWSLGGEAVTGVATGWEAFPLLRLGAGAAMDGASTPRSGDKPALPDMTDWGGRASAGIVSADGLLLLHAGISRRARFPSLREAYSGALGRFEPNPALGPELLTAAEAGFTRDGQYGRVQGVAFYRDLADAIERITLPDGRFQRVNRGALTSAGVELLGSTRLGALSLAGDVTLQRVRLHGDVHAGGFAEYQPDVLAGATARMQLPLRVQAGGAARFTGRQYCAHPDQPGQLALASSTRFDLDAARELRVRSGGGAFSVLELRAGVDNVADAAIYDQCGLPQAGRTLRLQLRAR
jgi:iron complex outermembrane recepter protein